MWPKVFWGGYSRRVLKISVFCRILLGRVSCRPFIVTMFLLALLKIIVDK